MIEIKDMSDKQLRQAYVLVCKQYNQAYKDKKDIENEMYKRFEIELEENR